MPQTSAISTPIAVSPTRIQQMPSGGWEITWADGNTNFYGSLSEIMERLTELVTPDLTKLLMLASWLARSPEGTNTNIILNKTLTLDLTSPNPWRMQ
jgi:hypothetical protein